MIEIPGKIVEKIKQEGKDKLPNEACGYLAGKDKRVSEIYPMYNKDQSPEHFSFRPKDQFKVKKKARQQGWDLISVYHTHPKTPARMSEEDKKLAFDPEITYVIYSLKEDNVKAFKIKEDEIVKEKIKVI